LRPVVFFSKTKKDKIFFLVPNYQMRSGGILSIYGLYEGTKKVSSDADSFLLAAPSNSYSFKQRWFDNKFFIYNLIAVQGQIKSAERILFQLPEMFITQNIQFLRTIRQTTNARIHINILNQNNLMMPGKSYIDELKGICDELTMTVNFTSDLTAENKLKWGVPLHYLPSWLIGTNLELLPYETKENILVVSDDHPLKQQIIDKVKDTFGVYVYNVKNVRYEDFMKMQRKAKWAISFGEGFDSIFNGAILCGGASFAVKSEFFPVDFPFDKLPNVFKDYEEMSVSIIDIMISLDNKKDYESLNQVLYPLIYKEFNYDMHLNALKAFYNKEYTIA